jgi:DNA-binding response OmpR family regulator
LNTNPARPRTILVVEDDAAIRREVTEALCEEGFEVLTAENGLEALGWPDWVPRAI